MDIQVIEHEMPFPRMRLALDEVLEVSKCILLIAGWSRRGFDDLTADHIEIDEPGQRPVPNVLEFSPQHMVCLHWQVRVLALQCLYPGQFMTPCHRESAY